jgi:predicted nucleic acid-binding protein
MIYCDTSLLVAALTPEAKSQAVQAWLRTLGPGELCISPWNVTEFSSAIALKVRAGKLSSDQKSDVLTQWREMQADQLLTVPVPGDAFDLAARFCDMAGAGLRAGDALHLAVASIGGHALATLDGRMHDGASAVGVKVVSIED